MAGAPLVVRVGGNIDDLKKALADGRVIIENTASSMDKLASRLGGAKAVKEAEQWAGALGKLAKGGDLAARASQLMAQDQAKLNTVMQRAIAVMGDQAPQAYRDLEQATRKAQKAQEDLGTSTGGVSGKLLAVASGIGAFFGALAASAVSAAIQGIKNIAAGLVEIVARGSQLAGISASFQNLTRSIGQSGDEMLRVSRSAAKGLIADMDVMAAANKAILLGLPVTAQEMGTLSSTAITLGKAMGLGPTQAMNDLITALGRGSPLILDNLGLTVKVGEANDAYAKKLGKTASELTEAEKKLAFYNAAMETAKQRVEDLGGVQLTFGDQVTRLKTAWQNFTDALGIGIATNQTLVTALGGLVDIVTDLTPSLDDAGRSFGWVTDLTIVFVRGLSSLASAVGEVGSFVLTVRGSLHGFGLGLAVASAYIGEFAVSALNLSKTLNPLGNVFGQIDKQIAEWAGRTTFAKGKVTELSAVVANDIDNQVSWDRRLKASSDRLEALAGSLEDTRGKTVKMAAAVRTGNQALDETSDAGDKAGAAIEKYRKKVEALDEKLRRGTESLAEFTRSLKGQDALPAFWLQAERSCAGIAKTLPTVTGNLSDATAGAVNFEAAVKEAVDQLKNGGAVASGFGKAIEDVFGRLPDIVMSAVTGGGNIGRSIGTLIGQELGKALADELSAVLAKTLGKRLGEAMKKLIPGIGGLVGGLLGSLFDKLGGWLGKAEGKKTNDLRDSFIAAAGGLGELDKKAAEAGMTLNQLLRAGNQKELERAITNLEAGFARFDARIKDVVSSLGQIGESGGLLTAGILREIESLKDNPQIREALAEFMQGQTAKGAGALSAIAGGTFTSAAGARGVGAGAAGIVAQMQQQGMSMAEIAAQVGPAIDELRAKFDAAGLSGGDAFNQIANSITYLRDESVAPLIASSQGVTDLMTSLANLGRLDADTFAGLAAQVRDTRDALIEQGKGGDEMMMAMQPQLQRIWELQQQFGYEVDEATQALIDEAEASGLVGDKFRPASDRMITAIDNLVARLGTFINKLMGLPEEAGDAADGIESKFGGIKIPPVEIEYTYKQRGGGPVWEGPPPGTEPEYMAKGAIVTRPTFAVIGEAGPEAVIPLEHLRRIEPAESGGGGGETVNLTANFFGVQKERWVRDEVMPQILNILRKGGGTLTDWQVALGV